MRRFFVSFAVIGAVIATFASMAPAGAASTPVPFQARVGKFLGLIPPAHVGASSTAGITNNGPASGRLYYNGGPVMTTNTVYAIYWAPSGYAFPKGYEANINGWFQNLHAANGANTNAYDTATQYYEKTSTGIHYIQDHTTFGGAVVDTDALPALDPVNCPDTPVAATNGGASAPSTTAGCVTDQQVQQEISTVVKKQGWTANNNTEFFMFTAPNIGTCLPATVGEGAGGVGTQASAPLCSFSYFCAYHSSYFDSTVSSNSGIIYANMPYAAQTAGNPLTCDEQSYPNGNPSDPEINVASHEHNESITDPFGTGWWDSNPNDSAAGEEIGDMCAWDFGNLYGAAGSQWNQNVNGHHYLMQVEWDNTMLGCPGSVSDGGIAGTGEQSTGIPVPSHPDYSIPEISLTPNVGYAGAPFKVSGLFFRPGDSLSTAFFNPGSKTGTAVAGATSNASGQFSEMARVPSSATAGKGNVLTSGSSGRASDPFTVPSR